MRHLFVFMFVYFIYTMFRGFIERNLKVSFAGYDLATSVGSDHCH